ncbi:hypothetical protein Tco_1049800 [Tanacetum coccineum]
MDEEIAKKMFEEEQAKIDWNDPSGQRYHTQLNRPYSVAEVRKNMIMYLKNQRGYKMSYFKGDMGFYEIHRADGNYKTYKFFSEMLNDFDKDDLIVLYRLFNEKYASTRPGFDDLILWGDMKIMFDPNKNGEIWKNHNSQELIEWKLYKFCGVHSLMLREVTIYMLVEKKYPLPRIHLQECLDGNFM